MAINRVIFPPYAIQLLLTGNESTRLQVLRGTMAINRVIFPPDAIQLLLTGIFSSIFYFKNIRYFRL